MIQPIGRFIFVTVSKVFSFSADSTGFKTFLKLTQKVATNDSAIQARVTHNYQEITCNFETIQANGSVTFR